MRHLRALTILAPLSVLAIAPALHADDTPACVRTSSWVQANGVGYNHVVTIENTCAKPAACVITTDVAPDPLQATVDPKQKVDLTTYRGSPASTFKAKVSCKLK